MTETQADPLDYLAKPSWPGPLDPWRRTDGIPMAADAPVLDFEPGPEPEPAVPVGPKPVKPPPIDLGRLRMLLRDAAVHGLEISGDGRERQVKIELPDDLKTYLGEVKKWDDYVWRIACWSMATFKAEAQAEGYLLSDTSIETAFAPHFGWTQVKLHGRWSTWLQLPAEVRDDDEWAFLSYTHWRYANTPCKTLSELWGRPLAEVYRLVLTAWRNQCDQTAGGGKAEQFGAYLAAIVAAAQKSSPPDDEQIQAEQERPLDDLMAEAQAEMQGQGQAGAEGQEPAEIEVPAPDERVLRQHEAARHNYKARYQLERYLITMPTLPADKAAWYRRVVLELEQDQQRYGLVYAGEESE